MSWFPYSWMEPFNESDVYFYRNILMSGFNRLYSGIDMDRPLPKRYDFLGGITNAPTNIIPTCSPSTTNIMMPFS